MSERINLTEERLNRGFSVVQMAEETGVSAATIQRAEDGKSIHPGSAFKIASFLGYKVTEVWPLEEAAA